MFVTTVVGLLLSIASGVYSEDGITRKLNVTREWTTSCMAQLNDQGRCDSYPLAHVVATSQQDELHVLVSLWAAPSCLLLRTPLGAQLNINWTLLTSKNQTGAITADGVLASYGFSMDQLIEFDDPADSADVEHANATALQPLALDLGAAGAVIDVSSSTKEGGDAEVTVSVHAPPRNDSAWTTVGEISFMVEVLNTDRRTEELPHLQQTGNSAVAGLVLNKLLTNSGFKHSRFGVQLITIGNLSQSLEVSKSMDDEYTPGVFKLVSLSSAAADAGYLQWRPVAYTAPEYTIEHSTTARHYSVEADPAATVTSPLLRAYFGERANTHRLNITFGLSEDGWYEDAKYAAWELTMGLGAPPTDQFSLMVILLLGIGLGLPTVALIGGGIWMVVRRVRGQTNTPNTLLVEEE